MGVVGTKAKGICWGVSWFLLDRYTSIVMLSHGTSVWISSNGNTHL
jgi:hypothetical protein